MPVTLMLPGALLPREVLPSLQASLSGTALAALLARAAPGGDTATDAPAHLAWLAEHLFAQDGAPATAPYAFAALAGTPSEAFLWHADPVHLELVRDHLVVTPLAIAPSEEESAALIAAANALASTAGARFARVQDRWFLQTERAWDLRIVPLEAALGQPLQACLPAGAEAPHWNRLLTEIQMAWHTLPVNEAREARGEATVNSVWLHGGGRWKRLEPGRFSAVFADAPEWRGAAQAASLPSGGSGDRPRDGDLVVWSELLTPRLTHDWDRWLAALRTIDRRLAEQARLAALDIVLTGEQVVRRATIRPGDRLKFWRTRSLDHALAE